MSKLWNLKKNIFMHVRSSIFKRSVHCLLLYFWTRISKKTCLLSNNELFNDANNLNEFQKQSLNLILCLSPYCFSHFWRQVEEIEPLFWEIVDTKNRVFVNYIWNAIDIVWIFFCNRFAWHRTENDWTYCLKLENVHFIQVIQCIRNAKRMWDSRILGFLNRMSRLWVYIWCVCVQHTIL